MCTFGVGVFRYSSASMLTRHASHHQGLRNEIATTQEAIKDRDASIARNEEMLQQLTATMATLLEKYQACEQEINGISQKNQALTTKTEHMTREVRKALRGIGTQCKR